MIVSTVLLEDTLSTTLLDAHHTQPVRLQFLHLASHPKMHSSTQHLLRLRAAEHANSVPQTKLFNLSHMDVTI